jgi:hypothetical protein
VVISTLFQGYSEHKKRATKKLDNGPQWESRDGQPVVWTKENQLQEPNSAKESQRPNTLRELVQVHYFLRATEEQHPRLQLRERLCWASEELGLIKGEERAKANGQHAY